MGNLRIPVGLDISDPDAVVGEVKTNSTFYAVSGGRKTLSGELDRVQLKAISGSFDNGKINIFTEV